MAKEFNFVHLLWRSILSDAKRQNTCLHNLLMMRYCKKKKGLHTRCILNTSYFFNIVKINMTEFKLTSSEAQLALFQSNDIKRRVSAFFTLIKPYSTVLKINTWKKFEKKQSFDLILVLQLSWKEFSISSVMLNLRRKRCP